MLANLDALLTALYVRVDDFLPKRCGPGHPPRITDAELIALAVAQMFLGIPNDRKFLALARWRLGHLFPYLPKQPGYNKRLRRLAPAIARSITHLAITSPSFCDNLRLLDSTPVPCGRCAKRPDAASWPVTPPTAGARATAATSGASGCICCARPTGCRSRSSSPSRATVRCRARARSSRRDRRARYSAIGSQISSATSSTRSGSGCAGSAGARTSPTQTQTASLSRRYRSSSLEWKTAPTICRRPGG